MKAATVVGWRRHAFGLFWYWKAAHQSPVRSGTHRDDERRKPALGSAPNWLRIPICWNCDVHLSRTHIYTGGIGFYNGSVLLAQSSLFSPRFSFSLFRRTHILSLPLQTTAEL